MNLFFLMIKLQGAKDACPNKPVYYLSTLLLLNYQELYSEDDRKLQIVVYDLGCLKNKLSKVLFENHYSIDFLNGTGTQFVCIKCCLGVMFRLHG